VPEHLPNMPSSAKKKKKKNSEQDGDTHTEGFQSTKYVNSGC
jgi:hypothetical protein